MSEVGRYWHEQGRHQKLYRRLYDELVPEEGEADTEAGEIVRVIGNVVYDVGNNGGCNFDGGRKSDLDQFVASLKENGFSGADELHAQLMGLVMARQHRHCSTCECDDDDHEEPPKLDPRLFDEAVDLLVLQADKLNKRKARK